MVSSISRDFFNSEEENNYSFSKLKDSIIDNVSNRAVSDVPTGVCLSGGIDSNLVTSILCKTNNPPQLAFTIHSKDNKYSEVDSAKLAAHEYKIEHIAVDINDFEYSGTILSRTDPEGSEETALLLFINENHTTFLTDNNPLENINIL